jgi:hypothetical protein
VWVILFLAYSGQVVANAILESYATGFGGGMALMFFSLALSQRPARRPPRRCCNPDSGY